MTLITGRITRRQGGFTYLLALIAVALTTIASTTAYISSRYSVKRAMEEEILFEGTAYYRAIKSYYLARTPHQYPRKISDLIRDPRYLYRRHLRKKYDLDGHEASWRFILNHQGSIIGVYLDSSDTPLQKTGFDTEFKNLNNAQTYRDWKFIVSTTNKVKQ